MAEPQQRLPAAHITVQVCWLPAHGPALLRTVCIPSGSSLADAVEASGLQSVLPDASWRDAGGQLRLAIYGVLKPAGARVWPGDRIDITRPLTVDPKEARRQRARKAAANRRATRA
ncbi:RnfH family protein [Thiomonas sp.]|uniref:RnfH family protein n=1 Tax=Thiomonas sp. TaxID=2047785 RepID=UPI00258E8608|nr:RnfH family protein [Thiomonas sp.]